MQQQGDEETDRSAYGGEEGDYWPYWNFVLDGDVAAMRYAEDGTVMTPWLVSSGSYFTGTAHAFTERYEDLFIEALVDTRVLQLPNYRLQQGQQQYHALSELINILKQRRIEQDALFDEVCRLNAGVARVYAFFESYPQLAPQLTAQQVSALLTISKSTYQRGKAHYYRNR